MAGLPDAGRRIGFATIDALADLHLVDPASVRARRARPPGRLRGAPAARVARTLAAGRHARSRRGDDGGGRAPRRARCPRRRAPTLLHNDFKTGQLPVPPGRARPGAAPVFDWDMATLGDPLVDLGTLMNYWPDPSDTHDDRAFHIEGMERFGFPSRAEAVARYAAATGFDVGDVAWYEAFAMLADVRDPPAAAPALRARREHRRADGQPRRPHRHAAPGAPGASSGERSRGSDDSDADRPDRQGRPRHRRQPGPRAGDGAGLRPLRRRRRHRQPQARRLRGPRRARCAPRPAGRRCRSPATSGGGPISTPSTPPSHGEFGRVDILVNNAGIAPLYPSLVEVGEELFDKVVAVNLKGPFRLTALIGGRMRAARRRVGDQRQQHRRRAPAASGPAVRRGQGRARTRSPSASPPPSGRRCGSTRSPPGRSSPTSPRRGTSSGFERFAKVRYPLQRLGQPVGDRRRGAVPGVRPVVVHDRLDDHRRRRRHGDVAVPARRGVIWAAGASSPDLGGSQRAKRRRRRPVRGLDEEIFIMRNG